MKKSNLLLILFFSLFWAPGLNAQTLLPGDSLMFGPIFSPVYNNKVRVWVLTKNHAHSGNKLHLSMTASGKTDTELTGKIYNADDRLGYSLRSYEFSDLQPGESYNAKLLVNGVESGRHCRIVNEQNILDDFTFLAGGCGRIYDTTRCIDIPETKTHFNGDPAMFNHMAREKSDLMVWLGDATYLLGLMHAAGQCPDGVDDWANKDRAFDRYMFYRTFHDSLTMAMPQLAITDNHDTGPNEFNKTMPTLGETREIFMDWWPNPEYLSTSEGQGLFSSYVYKDVEYFLTDNRSYRDGTHQHFGPEQLEWLKQGLLNSKATFKVVISGTPVFREVPGRNFSVSVQGPELHQFIQDHNINGVIAFSADIHDQRFMVRERDTKYPLFDILSGNLNSDVGKGKYATDYDAKDDILSGVKQAYVRVNVYGDKEDRRFKVEYVGFDGKTFFEEIIHEDMLTSQNDDALYLALDMNRRLADSSNHAHKVSGSHYTYSSVKDDKVNSALVFSKQTTVQIAASNALTFHDRSYTLSFRINPSAFEAHGSAIFSNGQSGKGLSFGISAEGNLIYKDYATGRIIGSKYRIQSDKWSYVTWKYNNVRRQLSLYCDGLLVETWHNVASTISSTSDLSIGNNIENQRFIGKVDHVELYGRLMDDQYILSKMN